ncbi:MAG: ASPIC/UnbV domain-containing protein, partial [Chloroflexota bacterium]|nr:ASPIC/UnbV domain-containing protein [Chloroflexota bacterium]
FFDAYKYNTYNAQWVDFDNDSDLDLYVTNAGDTYVGNQPNQLYQNNGDGTFTDVADSVGLSDLTSNNENCSAWADYNNDGFLDMFLANSEFTGPLAGLHKLYRNEGNDNHWLQITLTGTVSNRLGIGARIEVTTEDLTQFRQMGAEASNPCRNGFVAHFGLGQITTVDTITVTWPSGNVDVLEDVSADQILNITEDINSPTLTMTTPSDEATNVFLNQPIIVDFSEPMNTNSVNYIVTPTVSLTATWNKDDTQLTLTHNNFASNTTYTVEVTGQDKAGNSLIFNSVPNPWQFTTGTQTSPETDLSITQARIGTGSVTAGDSITYTLSITNGGPTAPVDATVVMSFNDATALSVVNGSNCSWPSNSKDVTCTISDVGSTLATLTLGVDTSLTYNGNLTSWVTIEPTGGVIDPNPENNDDGPLAVTVVGDGLNNAYLPTIVK